MPKVVVVAADRVPVADRLSQTKIQFDYLFKVEDLDCSLYIYKNK